MIVCPRCGQGYIYEVKIKKNNQTIFICEECDAVWFLVKDIGVTPFIDYGLFMQGLGYSSRWDEFDIINKDL